MNEAIIDYHERRRPFVIIPEIGIIFSRSGNAFAHNELLQNCGFSEERVHEIIENFPRGYFLDNRLVVYQGENVAEGESWTLKPENYKFVCSFYSDLCRIFKINAETRIFLGVKRGRPGELWPAVNEVGQDFFAMKIAPLRGAGVRAFYSDVSTGLLQRQRDLFAARVLRVS